MRKRGKLWLIALCLAVVLGIGIANSVAISKAPKFSAMHAYEKIEKTKGGITQYKQANEDKINKLNSEVGANEDVLVTITLSRHLDKEQFIKLVTDYDLKVHHANARAVESDTGLRATIGLPFGKDTVSEEELNRLLNNNKASFKGFIEIIAYVSNGRLKELSNDKRVFLADPSADKHLVNNPKGDFMQGVFWSLEDLNMVSE